MFSLLSLILTSLIGNLHALSRLFYAAACDDILPSRFAELNKSHIPANAMLLVGVLSIPILFVGRTAIGGIVDVTTLGATLIYGFVSAAALKTAQKEKRRRETVTGFIGFATMIVFGACLLFPALFGDDMLATETYILFMVWTVIGLLFFRSIIKKDHARRFGKAIIVWIVLLALVVFMAMIWSYRAEQKSTETAIFAIQDYFSDTARTDTEGDAAFIQEQLEQIQRTDRLNTLLVSGLFVMALGAMLVNHVSMKRWETKAVKERDAARQTAFTDPMTGAKSKHAYLTHEKAINTAIDNGTSPNFAVVVCDVNGLKKINDTLGHKAGDEYIRKAFDMICDIFQHSPVYRVGGDEFVVILTGRDYVIRNELLLALHDRSVEHIGTGGVVVSGGLSEYVSGEDMSYHSIFQRADELMYEEKKLLKGLGAVTRDDAEDLMLEITESAYTGDSEQVISTARELRGMGMGFRIEMDDFGTGYSSLGMLSQLPIDALKLDMSFIRSAFGEKCDMRMIELIIDIADYLRVPVVAEGVETEELYLVLKAMGCDLVQGYYFSKPVPPEEFDRFLLERGKISVPESVAKKSGISISKALTSDFESIFYVDVTSDYYLEFYNGAGGELEIRPGGKDFSSDIRDKFFNDICREDLPAVEAELSRERLQRCAGEDESISLPFRMKRGGSQKNYLLQSIRTRNSDDHHIVIGVRPE